MKLSPDYDGELGFSKHDYKTKDKFLISFLAIWVTRAWDSLWLLTTFLVPLMFLTPAIMEVGFEVPKVNLYRSLVGLIAVFWLLEWELTGLQFNSPALG